jgi:phosphoribosyl-AMP cyclohydrolase
MALFKKKKQSGDHPEREEFFIDDQHKIVFNSSGLIPVVIQDEGSSEVLRLAYMNKWALEMSLTEKKVYLFRRSLHRVELLGEKEGLEYEISTIKLGRNRRSMLFKIGVNAISNKHAEGDIKSEIGEVKMDFIHTIYSRKKQI